MLGGMETILAFIRRHIGVKGDAADQSGSVHAKLGYLANRTIIKSIQRGTINLGTNDTVKTATIAAVNPSKTMLNYLGSTSPGRSDYNSTTYGNSYYARTGHQFVRMELTNATTITARRQESNERPATVSYEVIEFV
jgi:hypothetical protein